MTEPLPGSLAERVTNLFVLFYCLDTVLSLLDEGAAALGHGYPLGFVRGPVGVFTLGLAALLYVAMAIWARLPKLILVPPILVALWIGLGALPFTLTTPGSAGLIAAGVEAVAALYLLFALHRRYGGFRMIEPAPGPNFHFATSLGFVAANLVLGPILAVALGGLTLASYIQTNTHGFVSFDRTGINLADRRYVRDDNVIRLVGMMHIGERSTYDELFQSFAVENTVVLAEGVSDTHKRLATFGYGRVASSLGLDTQPHLEEVLGEREEENGSGDADDNREWPHIEHADLDVSDFAPETIALLNRIGHLWSLPTAGEQLRELLAIAGEPGAEELPQRFNSDLIDKRNAHLLERVKTALDEYETVVVPWGGLHLPGIESEILDWGFVRRDSKSRRLLRYETIIAAMLGWDR